MKSDIQISQRLITPEQAKEMLTKNTENRKLSEGFIKSYVAQMKKGDWQLTGDPIKFSRSGRLLDGQHRLHAVIEYGKPVLMFVAVGLDDEIFTVLDTGKNRSAGDAVSTKGYKNANVLAATARSIIAFTRGMYSNKGGQRKYSNAITNTDVFEFIEKHDDLPELLNYAISIHHKFKHITQSNLAMLYFLLSKKDQHKADIFFEKYATGIDIGETSPIRLLRERLLRDLQNKRKLLAKDKNALFIKAWNAYITGKRMQNLILEADYVFPTPIGPSDK